VGPEDIVREPFPHYAIRGALDDALCDALIEEFPLEFVTRGRDQGNNKRLNQSAPEALAAADVGPLWRDVVETHLSQEFLDEALALLADPIRETYPSFESTFGQLDSLRAGTRRVQTFEEADVLLDAQIAINTPVTGESTSVRSGHVDASNKLFVALLYLRHPDDESTGGDLELYRYADDHPEFEGTPRWTSIDDSQLELVDTVPYEKNQLVFFMNSPDALHGVTPRSRTESPRLFLNLIAEVSQPLFEVTLVAPTH
jgi:hypothetical protein